MIALVIGLVVFLGTHWIGVLAPRFRERHIARLGIGTYKGAYTLASIVGLALLIWGYGMARKIPVVLWAGGESMRHATAALSVLGFVLIASAYVPRNRIRQVLGHPMTLGVGSWAFGHLLTNGRLADVILFGAFLVWSAVTFATRRRRDREAHVAYARDGPPRARIAPPGGQRSSETASVGGSYTRGNVTHDAIAVVAGVAIAMIFAIFLHGPLIGVRPFGS